MKTTKEKKKKHGVLLCDSVPYCHYPMEGDFLFLSFFFFFLHGCQTLVYI